MTTLFKQSAAHWTQNAPPGQQKTVASYQIFPQQASCQLSPKHPVGKGPIIPSCNCSQGVRMSSIELLGCNKHALRKIPNPPHTMKINININITFRFPFTMCMWSLMRYDVHRFRRSWLGNWKSPVIWDWQWSSKSYNPLLPRLSYKCKQFFLFSWLFFWFSRNLKFLGHFNLCRWLKSFNQTILCSHCSAFVIN